MNRYNYTSPFLDSVRKTTAPKPRGVQKPRMKQYGDAGYKPATGSGTSY